ncbi:MAG: ATP-binding protein [Chlamydiae bacterium]|nr:ATP-binding protein [Chlamydiota bacterium]
MRFIAGPRQSGKTTLARAQLQKMGSPSCYFNWDLRTVRSSYRQNPLFYWDARYALDPHLQKCWVCFDEIHKMPKWKNILKEAFDEKEKEIQFIVTGSARLDLFRKSGDSLVGRYFLFHLFPVTLRELIGKIDIDPPSSMAKDWIEKKLSYHPKEGEPLKTLLQLSGFPEPLLQQSKTFHQKWKETYIDQLIREDLRDLTHIQELENVATLIQILPSRIGSPLSINSLKQDLEVSYNALKNYLRALELTYILFTISPYHRKIMRSVKKEKKFYFYDWTRILDPAARFENFVAVQLQTLTTFWNDSGHGPFSLFYIRTQDGKETDFLITENRTPWLLIEVKQSRRPIENHHLNHARELGHIPFIQLTEESNLASREGENVWVISAERLLT